MSNKTRLDVLLVERGLAESRQKAQAVIMAGHVFVAGVLTSPARQWPTTRLLRCGVRLCGM